MYHLMGEEIAVNAKVVLTSRAFVAAAYTHPLGVILGGLPLVLRRHCRESKPTGKTRGAS